MKEIEFTLNNAMLVWWFIAWRTFLVLLILNIILALTIKNIYENNDLILMLADWGSIVVSVAVTIYFTRKAVNINYLSKTTGSFRLSALELTQAEIEADPRFSYKKGPQPIDLGTLQK